MAGLNVQMRITSTGGREVVQALEKLKTGVRNRVVRLAIAKEQTPNLALAKSLAPKDSGLLRKSLGRRQKTYPKLGKIIEYIGPQRGFQGMVNRGKGKAKRQQFAKAFKYAHLADAPTKPHTIAPKRKKRLAFPLKSGQYLSLRRVSHPGTVGKPFLSAAAKRLPAAKSKLLRNLAEGIEREAAKVAAKS